MIGSALTKYTLTDQDGEFIAHLEHNLNALSPELQLKLIRLNLFSNAFDIGGDPLAQNALKSVIIELLNDFIQSGYQPAFVGKGLGYYFYNEKQPIPRLAAFKENYDPNAPQPTSRSLVLTFSALSASAKPFIPRSANTTAAPAEISSNLSASA